MVRSETSSSRDRCCAVVKRRRRRIWMIENRRSARRMAGFWSRPPIMQARRLPRPRPFPLSRWRLDADVAAEMLAERRRRMLPQPAADGGLQAAEQRLRLISRAMRVAGGGEAADEFEQQLGGDHGGGSFAGAVGDWRMLTT